MADDNILKVLGENPSRKEILAHWNPENETFWQKYGKKIADQNLYVSTWALTLSFVVWTLWATIAAQLNPVGFNFTDAQIFTLASLPGLVGATCRLFYTYMPGIVGGKNWTLISTALLLLPIIGLGGAFLIPKIFGWAYSNYNLVTPAFYVLIAFTVIIIAITWIFYARPNSGIKC